MTLEMLSRPPVGAVYGSGILTTVYCQEGGLASLLFMNHAITRKISLYKKSEATPNDKRDNLPQ